MMARVDDVSHMKLDNLKPHLDYSFVLLSKTNWSKNIYEERQTPDQILFGSMDAKNCVLLALAIHFETWFASYGLTSDYMFGFSSDPERTKRKIRVLVRNMFGSDSLDQE